MGGRQSKPSSGNATLVDALEVVPGITQRLNADDCMSLLRTSRDVRNAVVRHRPATLRVTHNSLRALMRRPEQPGDLLTVNYDGLCVPAGDAWKLLAALEGCNMRSLEAAGNPADHVRAVRRVLERSIQNLTPLHVVSLHLNAPLPGVQSGGAGMDGLESELAALRQVLRQPLRATGRQATKVVVFEADGCTATTRAAAEAFEVLRLTGKADVLSMTGVLRTHHDTLEELDVTGEFRLERDLWRWIGRARNLRVLRLAKSGMTPNLVNNPSFQQRMVDALLACEQLEVLEVRSNVLPEAVIDRIMPRLVTLRELRLRSCGIRHYVAEVLAAGLTEARGGTLRVLDLSNVRVLSVGLWCQNAVNLAAALPSLAGLLKCGRLEELHLSGVGLTDGGASSLAEAIEDESCKLRVLDVSNNHMREDVAALGAAIGASRTLEVVSLDRNFIDDEGLSAIGRGLQLSKSIRELSLCPWLPFAFEPWTEGAQSLGEGLRRTRSLRVLRVDAITFQAADCAAILDGLAVNSSVEVLSMFNWVGNTVDDRVARMVAGMLRRNRTLRSLNMLWKNVTTHGLAAIGSALRSGNETLQYLSEDRDEDGRCPLRQLAVRNSKVAASESRSPPDRWGAVGSVSLYVLAFFAIGRVEKVLQQRQAAPRGRSAAGGAPLRAKTPQPLSRPSASSPLRWRLAWLGSRQA